jgi:translation elongation factor P/translation initiation factor 5A
MRDTHPCKVIEIKKSTPGRHSHAKYNITGIDIITSKKITQLFKHRDLYTNVETHKNNYDVIELDYNDIRDCYYLVYFDTNDHNKKQVELTEINHGLIKNKGIKQQVEILEIEMMDGSYKYKYSKLAPEPRQH